MLPSVLASLLALLVRAVAPDVVDVVQATDLWEESRVSLVIVATEVDCTCPVVAPFNHRAWLQSVRAHFVDVAAAAWFHHWPVAEPKQVLKMSWSQETAAFSSELDVVLKVNKAKRHDKRDEGFKEACAITHWILHQLLLSEIDLLKPTGVAPQLRKVKCQKDLRDTDNFSHLHARIDPSRRLAPTSSQPAHTISPFSTRSTAPSSC